MKPACSRAKLSAGTTSLHHDGASLIACLIVLVAIMMMGLSAANIAIQAEKGARSDRDHQIAFQAAEAALVDAELDIVKSPNVSRTRSALFSSSRADGFPAAGEALCHTSESKYFGLCQKAPDGSPPTWLTVDFLDDSSAATSVPYGTFTGKTFQAGKGPLPSRVPRYIIELMPFKDSTGNEASLSYLYRITAIGFGAHSTSQVVLQTFFRKGT